MVQAFSMWRTFKKIDGVLNFLSNSILLYTFLFEKMKLWPIKLFRNESYVFQNSFMEIKSIERINTEDFLCNVEVKVF